MSEQNYNELDIAIVGMAGRFPDANNVDALWRNVKEGKSAVRQLDVQQLLDAGVTEQDLANPDYVKVAIPFADKDQFDAGFFGYSPKEATQLDPQQRLFLQTCWHALEDAGLPQAGQFTGVYAGCGLPAYLMNNLLPQQKDKDITSLLALTNGSEKDSLATRVSYELDLTGPAVTVQTACSTSLVAVHMACRGLQNYECDAALAGGVWLNLLDDQGYLAPTGGSLSPSGQLSAFSEQADGILIGSGTAAVVLKRVSDAIEDGDHILAVIKGSAINNDGRDKVGYTAPSVNGQSNAIAAALEFADVDPRSIGYIETHGTGTVLGDPIEIAALSRAYQSDDKQYCAIGSIKANIGHLDSAAGVTGLIKAVQALRHQTIPISINSTPHNSKIDFANSPFYLPEQTQPWQSDSPRRAAVSSLGMGGTNAHVILEEFTPLEAKDESPKPWHILPISAANADTVASQKSALHDSLNQHYEKLSVLSAQLQHHRRALPERRAIVCTDVAHALAQLNKGDELERTGKAGENKIALLFSGQGSQYVTMAQSLYRDVSPYRRAHDAILAQFEAALQTELKSVFFPADDEILTANQLLNQTRITQPALFIVGYAMAQCYQAFGIRVSGMLGHSIGQYVAACVAGVMSESDAVKLVTRRGEILQNMAPGTMLSVMSDEAQLQSYLNDGLSIAALNSPTNTVLAGTRDAIKAVQSQLKADGISCTRLHVSQAFHSHLTEAVLPEFEQVLSEITLLPPSEPYVSDFTGTWITAEQATSKQYWLDHIRQPVNFKAGIETLTAQCNILVEAGPGDTLQKLAKQCTGEDVTVYHSIAHVRDLKSVIPPFAKTLASLWEHGCDVNWLQLTQPASGHEMLAPAYQFAKTRYWQEQSQTIPNLMGHTQDATPSLYEPIWKQISTCVLERKTFAQQRWLVLQDDSAFSELLSLELSACGVVVVNAWDTKGEFQQLGKHKYALNFGDFEHLNSLVEQFHGFDRILDLRLLSVNQQCGYSTLLPICQWAANTRIDLTVLATQLFSVLGNESISPSKAMSLGLLRAFNHEHSETRVQLIELDSEALTESSPTLVSSVIAQFNTEAQKELAVRGRHGFVLSQQKVAPSQQSLDIDNQTGTVLITGGLGGVGMILTELLAKKGNKVALLSRRSFPDKSQWSSLIAADEDPNLCKQLKLLSQLNKTHDAVHIVRADVTDKQSLEQAVECIESKLGTITQVIHSAGTAGGGLISQKNSDSALDAMSAKIVGTDNLLGVFRHHELEQMVLCSSLSAVTGIYGQSDYCAANCYLDAVAKQSYKFPVKSLNWDAWLDIGMAQGYRIEGQFALTAESGSQLFLIASQCCMQQMYALSAPWQDVVQQLKELTKKVLSSKLSTKVKKLVRADLDVEYEAPESDIEKHIANLWSEALGYEKVGIFDSFFELGGDSLVAIQMVAKVKQRFNIDIEPSAFFEDPTIDNLAYLIEEALLA